MAKDPGPPVDGKPTWLRVVIFSRDRALQLDATLNSLRRNCIDIDVADVRVLYRTSTPRFAAQYRVVTNQHPWVTFFRETDFRSNLLELLIDTEFVIFLVDDTLFVGELSVREAAGQLSHVDAALGFSFRLGENTTYCYSLDKPQLVPTFVGSGATMRTFNWTEAEHDFGYPLEVSSSLYRTSDLLPLVRGLSYRNPNTLESVLAQHADSFRTSRPLLLCYQRSVAFSVPANMVQSEWANRSQSDPRLTAEALAQQYDLGQRVDVGHFRGFEPIAAHQEVELVFAKHPTIPLVSIVVPCYNQAAFLPDAVRSVARQTLADWEVIVVDDGSDDDTHKVAAELVQEVGPRVRVMRQANRGLAEARNAGIVSALGRYILPLDADDMIEPEMLRRTVALLDQNPELSIAYTDVREFGEDARDITSAAFDRDRLAETNQLSYCALYRREVWEAVGGYKANMTWGYEDWDFWLAAAESGYVGRRIPEPLFKYRVRGNSMYATALAHDSQLRRQLALNHPEVYSLRRRTQRFIRKACRAAASRLH